MPVDIKVGDILDVEVNKITDFGAFVKIDGNKQGLIHISQVADSFVKNISDHLKLGDKVKARVLKLGPGKKIDLTLKKSAANASPRAGSGFKSSDFEDKLKKFLQHSQYNLTAVQKHNEQYRR